MKKESINKRIAAGFPKKRFLVLPALILFFVFSFLLFTTYYLLLTPSPSLPLAHAQTCQPGQQCSAIGTDSSYNLSIGTSTTQSDTKLLIVGTSTASGYFAIKVLDVNKGPLFIVRSDGSVSIGGNQIFNNKTTGATTTVPGVGSAPATGALYVNGPIYADGMLTFGPSGGLAGATLIAGNISGGVFSSNGTQSNFAFPLSLGVGTSSQVGLPQPLSVYGNAYVSGNVGIGTTGPGYLLSLPITGTIGIGTPDIVNTAGVAITASSTVGGGVAEVRFRNTSNYTTALRQIGYSMESWNYNGNARANFLADKFIGNSIWDPIGWKIATFGGGQMVVGAVGQTVAMIPLIVHQNDSGTSMFEVQNNSGTAVLEVNKDGNVGIGTSTPQALLSVGNNTSSLVAVFGGGSGKIAVGTVDPVYTINGTKYATYLPGMTGQKEETTGIVHVICGTQHVTGNMLQDTCSAVLDLKNAEQGSDLWLFSKTTNISAGGGSSSGGKDNFEKMAALLTPSFDGRVWYEKDAKNLRLTIFANPNANVSCSMLHASCEVSYRLTAPRFDASRWTNLAEPTENSAGFIIPE